MAPFGFGAAPNGLLPVAPQRCAQEAELPLEARARVAKEKMQANARPLGERDVPILHPRDQTARVLARDQ